jgi:glycosyltransferase involved in cell wall biosynthesis
MTGRTTNDARLLYFTDSYPFGLGEEWKRVELEIFREYFETIEVVPLHYCGNPLPKPAIDGIRYHLPLFPDGVPQAPRAKRLATLFAHDQRHLFFRELWQKQAFGSRARFDRWLRSSEFAARLSKHAGLATLLAVAPERTILYFFWARGSSELLPLVDTSAYRRTVLRLHGYDLYADPAQGWVPYQHQQLRQATDILPCSEHGANYLRALYPELSSRIQPARLGTAFRGRSRASDDGVLRIVTCSMVLPIKQLHLVTEALRVVSSEVHWTHIGDGELYDDLRARADALRDRPNVKSTFVGRLDPRDVAQFYIDHPADLFLNVSYSEGLPVSIMEAFAAGIPACATAVGGTPEIVDDSCGRLLPHDSSPVTIAAEIDAFARLPPEQRTVLRENAFTKFNSMFEAHRNAHTLAARLSREESQGTGSAQRGL